MKSFKKFLSVVAAILLALTFAGCGEYRPPEGEKNPSGPINPNPVNPGPDIPANGFIVELNPIISSSASLRVQDTARKEKLYSQYLSKMQAQWTDTETGEVFRSGFNDKGVAARTDLDGDYMVTLVNLPAELTDPKTNRTSEGYTYKSSDPAHLVTNDEKKVVIDLWPIRPKGKLEYYGPEQLPYYSLASTGAYSLTLGVGEKILFNFRPDSQGEYILETFADTTANVINPKLEVYNGILPFFAALDKPASSQDGGGAENTYTKNIKWSYNIPSDEVGNGLIFMLFTESRDPKAEKLVIDFILEWEGDATSGTWEASESVAVKETLKKQAEPSGVNFVRCVDAPGANKVLDSGLVDLYKTEDGGDGYYHYFTVVNGQKVWGDLLYAQITAPNAVHDQFTHPMMRLHYIKASLSSKPNNYTGFISKYAQYCSTVEYDSNGNIVDGEGVYPVTAELRQFLQDYAKSEMIFLDDTGNGMADSMGIKSNEASMWMYACGYFPGVKQETLAP